MPASEEFSVDRMAVKRMAELARIEVPDDQVESTRADLASILEFIAILDGLDLTDVEPFFGASGQEQALSDQPIRPDEQRPSTAREDVLSNAPDHDEEFYRVPPVFD